MEEKQLEFVRSLYGKYGITDENKINYATQAFKNDFDGALNAFYSKYNPEKEINQGYFNQIKSSYFTPIDPVAQVSQPVEMQTQEEAPSGFWANFKNSLDNVPESVANGFWMTLNAVDRNIDNVFDVAIESLTGIPQDGASANTEFFMNKIQQNNAAMKQVKGVLEEGATIPERIAGGIDATIQFARSIATGVASFGALPMIEQYESMYLDAVETKAKELGVNPLQLIIDNQDDEFEPLLYGAAAGVLERVGMGSVTKYIQSLPKDAKSSVFKWLYANAKEGGTEWAQEVLAFVNEERAKGLSVPEALAEAANRGFSREGAEVFATGFVGAAGIGAAGKGIKRLVGQPEDAQDQTETPEITPEQQQSVDNKMAAAGSIVKAAESTVDTGDAEIDQLVQNTLRETEQELESKLLRDEQEKARLQAQKEQEKLVKQQEAEAKKEAAKKEKAQAKVDEAVAKDVSKTVKDKASLKKAVYSFLGVTETKENVDEVNAYVNFFDGIATARSKREGISKEEWYKSRVASIGTTQDKERPTGTSFLEDGRATITALQAGNPRDFFRGFAQVIQRDLDETESAALEAEFGINFREDFSDESIDTFGRAFESYLQTGVVPEGIKGNNASFVKAAFEKISNWLRDIKSAIQGESSLYVNSNVRRIFDSIVTGQELQQEQTQEEINDTTTEGEVDTNEQLDRPVATEEQVVTDESGETGGAVVTESAINQPAEQDVVDLTKDQETIEEPTEQQTVVEDEQKTETESDEGVLQSPKTTRPKPQADARKRRDDAFAKASKPFEAKPGGGIKGGNSEIDKAIKSLIDLQSDAGQDELTKQEARNEMIRLMDIKGESERNLKLKKDRDNLLGKIKEDAKNSGYSLSGINSFFSKKSLVPLEYDNGEVLYFDLETGERGSYSLSEEKAKKGISQEQWEEGANERLKKEDKRKSDRLIAENIKKEAEERAKIEASKKASLDKESNKANAVYSKTINSTATSKNIVSTVKDIDSIDLDNAFSSKREGDVPRESLRKSVKSFISDFLSDLKDFSTDRQMISNKKRLLETRESLLNFAKNSPLLKESDRTEIIQRIKDLDQMFDLEISSQEARKSKKEQDKIIGSKKGTVLDERTTVQSVGFSEEVGKKISGMLSDFLRGFGLKRKIIVVDSDFFSNNNRPEFKGLTEEEIKSLRDGELLRIAAIMSRQKLWDASTSSYEKMSFDSVLSRLTGSMGDVISGVSSGLAMTGDTFSVISANSRDKSMLTTSMHEFGHILEKDLFNELDQSKKEEILKEFEAWKEKRSGVKNNFVTPERMARRSVSKSDDFDNFGKDFSEYFAEQVSYWANTQEKPSGVVEKFFSDVAKALRKLFERFREDYGVSQSITKLLNDQFSFDGFRATKQQKASRDFIIDESAKVMMSIMDNNRKLIDVENVLANARATSKEQAKEIAAKKAANRKVKETLEQKNQAAEKKLDDFYEEYKANGGTMDRASFNERINKLADERLTRKIVSDTLGRLSEMLIDEDGDTDGMPAVDFSKNVSNPRSGDKRKIFLDKLSTALEGRFNNINEFDNIIKSINKSLTSAGEPTITRRERGVILSNTKSGSIALVTAPIYLSKLKNSPTKEIIELIKSFSASRSERDDALAEADLMIKSGKTLTDSEKDKFNRLQLVGLFNTTVDERKKLIKDKIAESIAKNESSKVQDRIDSRANEDRLIITEAFYESILGFEKVADGEYRGTIKGMTRTIKVYDRNKTFRKGDIVEYGGKFYTVNELIEPRTKGWKKKMSQFASANQHSTNAGLAAEAKKRSGFIQAMNRLFLATHGIESIANMLKEKSKDASFEGALSRMIGEEGFRRAAMNKRNHQFKVEGMYKELGERIFGVKGLTKVNKKIYDLKTAVRSIKFKDNDGHDVEIKMTVGEMMTWYAYMGQPDLVSKFQNMEEKFKTMPEDSRFWNKSKGDAVIDSLKEEEKDFVKGVITEIMPYVYQTLNKAHLREMGYDLQLIENYFPTRVEVSETDSRKTSAIDTVQTNFSKFIASVSNRNIKERRSNNPLVAGDFFGQFMQYSDKSFHYAEYVGPLKRASLLFQNEKYDYAGYINTKFGEEFTRQIKINLDNIAFGGSSRTVGMKNYLFDTLRSLNIGGAFMANATMFFKQTASFIALADSMSWRDFTKYYITADWKTRLEDYKSIREMNFIKERMAQGGRVSYDTQGLMFDKVEKELNRSLISRNSEVAIAKINKVLFWPVMAGDLGAIYFGGIPLIRDLKKKAEVKFPSDKDKQKEWVELKFEEAISRTQQSRDIMDQSDYQTAGSWAQWMVTFMSTPILYGRVLAGALRDVRKGYKNGDKALLKKGLKTGAMFSAIAPLFFQVASTGGELIIDSFGYGDDEEEDQLLAWKYNISMIGVSFVQHIPVIYPYMQNAVDYMVKGDDFDPSISAPMAITDKGFASLRNIFKDVWDGEFEFSDESTQRDINNVSRALGFNYKGIKSLASNWLELFEEGSVEDWRLLLGYSEYAIE